MTGEEIVSRVCATYEMLDCRKFSGHVAVEIMKQVLAEKGIETSARDVFIRGLPIEWDLLAWSCIPSAAQAKATSALSKPSPTS